MYLTAIVLQIVLLAYHLIFTLFDFFPFNGARFSTWRDRLLECSFNDTLMALPPVGFIFHIRWLMIGGVIYYFFLFVGEVCTWYIPYFLGAPKKWREMYDRVFAKTILLPLPRRGNNPIPNLEHTILKVLTLATAIATLLAWRSL